MNTSHVVRIAAAAAVCVLSLVLADSAAAQTIRVRAGENLQLAINAAQPGDTLLLDPGATYTGNFVLPVKPGATYITIRTAAADGQPGPNSRVTPAHSPLLAKIRSSNAMPALATAPGAHHWRLQLLEFPGNRGGYGDILQIGDGSSDQNSPDKVPYELDLDRLYIHGDPQLGQKRGIALNAAAVTIRNCHITEIKAIGMDTQAIGGWNGPGPFVIENNYLEAAGENVMFGGADPAIPNLVSDTILVRHNYMTRPMSWRDPIVAQPAGVAATAAAGGSLPAGAYSYQVVARRPVGSGATARSTASSAVAINVESAGSAVNLSWTAVAGAAEYLVYRRGPDGTSQNWTVAAPAFTDTGAAGRSGAAPTTAGDRWLVKNIFELKNARNVVIEYNIFENHWAHGQPGYSILFTPRNQDGACTWCVVEHVRFQYNVVRNVAAGVNILGADDISPSQQTRSIEIRHNVFQMRRSLGGTAWFLLILEGPANVVADHNTIDADGTAILYVSGGTATAPKTVSNFRFTNNATRHGEYGINGAHYSYGNAIISGYFPGGVVSGNWLQGGPSSRYPSGNHFAGAFADAFVDAAVGNYQPKPDSLLLGRAPDGTDIGADIAALTDALRAVTTGNRSGRPSPPTNLRIIK